jgi:hypothetical protein
MRAEQDLLMQQYAWDGGRDDGGNREYGGPTLSSAQLAGLWSTFSGQSMEGALAAVDGAMANRFASGLSTGSVSDIQSGAAWFGFNVAVTVGAPNSGFDPVLADAVINGSADFRTVSSGRGMPARAANPAQIELELMRQIGAERDPVRRSVLETQLARFQSANDIRPPGVPQNTTISAVGSPPTLITNPKHNPNSVSPQPRNFMDLFRNSIPDASGVRWSIDQSGVIHRFSAPSNGQVHWNGSTATPNRPIQERNIPNEILTQLRPGG